MAKKRVIAPWSNLAALSVLSHEFQVRIELLEMLYRGRQILPARSLTGVQLFDRGAVATVLRVRGDLE